MFKFKFSKDKAASGQEPGGKQENRSRESTSKEDKPRKPVNWIKVLILSNITVIVLVALGIGGMAVINQSDTNPNFCGLCHIMQKNVNSYLTGHNMDNVHKDAGVQCKDCHDYPVQAEIASGVNYLVGNYTVNKQGDLQKRTFSDEMCLKCHVSQQYLANSTDFLYSNPHNSHLGYQSCSTCHVSHGEQIDNCSGCHDNGDQRITGGVIKDRGTIGQFQLQTGETTAVQGEK